MDMYIIACLIYMYMYMYIYNVGRPKGENVDVKALGDYDGGMSKLILLCNIKY